MKSSSLIKKERSILSVFHKSSVSTLIVFLLVFSFGMDVEAAKSKRGKFSPTKTITLDSEGISMKLTKSCKAVLQKSVEALGTMTIDGKPGVLVYNVRDIWTYNEYLCTWEDSSENTFHLKRISELMPEADELKQLPATAYKKAIADGGKVDFTDIKNIKKWYKTYSNSTADIETKILPKTSSFIVVELKNSSNEYCYAFRHKNSKSVYFIQYILNDNISKKIADKAVLKALLGTKFFRPKVSSQNKSKTSSRNGKEKSEEFIASLNRVIKEVKGLKSWWYTTTDDYIIASNLTSKNRRLANTVEKDITSMRKAYEKIIPAWSPFKEVSVVKVFGDRESYLEYAGQGFEDSVGVWVSSRKELIVSSLPSWGKKKDNTFLVLTTTYHEAFHQYIYYAFEGVLTSTWFNEGHACFFEGAKLKSKKITIEEAEEYLANFLPKTVGTRSVDLKKQIMMDYEEFYGPNSKSNYAIAWSLIYYLRKVCWKDKKSPYKNILSDYVNNLKELRDEKKATAKTFEKIDMDKFTADYMRFWRSKSKRRKAEKTLIFKDVRTK